MDRDADEPGRNRADALPDDSEIEKGLEDSGVLGVVLHRDLRVRDGLSGIDRDRAERFVRLRVHHLEREISVSVATGNELAGVGVPEGVDLECFGGFHFGVPFIHA